MFTSLQKNAGIHITSLSKHWRGREPELRKFGQADVLVCPYCKELVTFRSGEVNRPHFAHRQDSQCPLKGKRTPQEMEAKAQLYEALEQVWPGEVHMDAILEDETQPIDLLLLKEGQPFAAYWTLSRSIRKWDDFVASAVDHQIPYHILYTDDAHKHPEDQLILQKQQRDQIRHSREFDHCEFPTHGHLTFIDTLSSQLIIYRSLTCVHSPTGHHYEHKRTAPLPLLHIHTHGELITSEDLCYAKEQEIRLKHAQEEAHCRSEEKRQKELAKQNAEKAHIEHFQQPQQRQCIHCHNQSDQWSIQLPDGKCVCTPCLPHHNTQNSAESNRFTAPLASPEPIQPPASHILNKEVYTCRYCNKETSEWSVGTPAKKLCICHDCLPEHNRRNPVQW